MKLKSYNLFIHKRNSALNCILNIKPPFRTDRRKNCSVGKIRSLARFFLLNTYFFTSASIDMDILYRIWFSMLSSQTLYDLSLQCKEHSDDIYQGFKETYIMPYYISCSFLSEEEKEYRNLYLGLFEEEPRDLKRIYDEDLSLRRRKKFLSSDLYLSKAASYDIVFVFLREIAFLLSSLKIE